MPSPTPCGLGGDLWVDGETGEGGVDLGADEALSSHPRLYQVANIWISKHSLLQYEILVDDHINVNCQISELKSFPRRSLWDSLKIKSTMNWSWSSTDIWLRYCLSEKYFGFKSFFLFSLVNTSTTTWASANTTDLSRTQIQSERWTDELYENFERKKLGPWL